MKLVRESLLEFHQTGDPLGALNICPYQAYIDAIFHGLNLQKESYKVINKKTVFSGNFSISELHSKALTELPDNLTVYGDLNLYNCKALPALPNGLNVIGSLYLNRCISLSELPNDLKVGGILCLYKCKLTVLPDNLKVGEAIWVGPNQTELIKFIMQSKFKDKLKLYKER